MRFRKTRRGIETEPDPAEAALLRRCAEDLLVLLGEDERDASDPLEAMLGVSSGPVPPPEDPALARLLPDAYGADDPEASQDFRRYTEGDLRAGKRAAATTVLATLAAVPPSGRLLLDRAQVDAWLGWLNDVRLVLGTRLEVTEDLDPVDLDPDDPRTGALHVYGWLGWLQESLLSCLMPRR